jgi:hypothetical protein
MYLFNFEALFHLSYFLSGFWIRETKETESGPSAISIFDSSEEENLDEVGSSSDYQTESYHIADLFVATTTPK